MPIGNWASTLIDLGSIYELLEVPHAAARLWVSAIFPLAGDSLLVSGLYIKRIKSYRVEEPHMRTNAILKRLQEKAKHAGWRVYITRKALA
jgi:hypothetical protein